MIPLVFLGGVGGAAVGGLATGGVVVGGLATGGAVVGGLTAGGVGVGGFATGGDGCVVLGGTGEVATYATWNNGARVEVFSGAGEVTKDAACSIQKS